MSEDENHSRREFLRRVAVGAVAARIGAGAHAESKQAAAAPEKPQRVTLAQLRSIADVERNVSRAKEVFQQAEKDRAGWVFFPELFLTGTHAGAGFDQSRVAKAFTELQALCAKSQAIGLIGTGWKERGRIYNQIRIVDAAGRLVGQYGKRCLTYNDAEEFGPGTGPLVYTAGGITFGTLICNDLWVTPGFSDGPNPHLTLKQSRAGAQVIFHAIGSGSDQRYRAYHESNLLARAVEAKCPIVAVNAFAPPEVNATSGVVGSGFRYVCALPRDREVVQSVDFTPASPRSFR